MSSVKQRSKSISKKPIKNKATETEEEKPFTTREAAGKPIDLEELTPLGESDEKMDSDSLINDSDTDLDAEELTLDDEELNPFGDKWEM